MSPSEGLFRSGISTTFRFLIFAHDVQSVLGKLDERVDVHRRLLQEGQGIHAYLFPSLYPKA